MMRIVPLLSDRGWEFSFWAPRPSALYDHLLSEGHDVAGAPRFVEYTARAWRLPPGPVARGRSVVPYLRRFRSFLRERSPALVHANSIMTIAEGITARISGCPGLLYVHEMIPRGPRGRLLRRVAWTFDEVVTVSQASAGRLSGNGRSPRIVHGGSPVPERPAEIRSGPRPFRIGTVGVVSSRKGSDLFVEAARRLLADPERYAFEMVGPPNEELERDWARGVLSEASSLGVAHRTRADTFERYRSWDAFVLPARSDPFPLSMLEAMATGIPVVGSRVDGIAEQIAEGCGVLVEPEDPGALAEAIASLAASDAEVRRAMGEAARERVASRFNVERQADGMHEAYLATLGSTVA